MSEVYITDDEIAALPEEPELRFIGLEAIVRDRLRDAIGELDQQDDERVLQRKYVSIVLPAAKYYGIEPLSKWVEPAIDADWQYYAKFISDVDFCLTKLRLRNIEQSRAHSVALNADSKTKLRSMLNHIRETVDKLDVSVAKKEALYARINDLQDEIDRDRTRWQAFAALMIEACDDFGQAAKRLQPVVRLIERVGGVLGGAKREEDARPKLPPRKEPKQIKGPKREAKQTEPPKDEANGFNKQLDDEMPF